MPVAGQSLPMCGFFRSRPLLVLRILVDTLSPMFPALGSARLGAVAAVPCGLIALVITATAYVAKMHRGGLMGVAKGQHEARRAQDIRLLGRIGTPQTLRISLPSRGAAFIIVKMIALVSVISLTEIRLLGQWR